MLIIITLAVAPVPAQLPAIRGSALDMAHFLDWLSPGAVAKNKKIKHQENSSMDLIMPIVILVAYFLLMKFVFPRMGIPT